MLVVKKLLANLGDISDLGSTPGTGKYPGGGHGNPLQYSCLENPMDIGACQAIVYRVTKSWIGLKQLSTHIHAWLHVFPKQNHVYTGLSLYFPGAVLSERFHWQSASQAIVFSKTLNKAQLTVLIGCIFLSLFLYRSFLNLISNSSELHFKVSLYYIATQLS